MATPPSSLTELIGRVQEAAGPGDELEQLAGAISLSEDVLSLGDSVVGHFVDQARAAGHSWTAIGDRLGVSKQAARKRFGVHDEMRSTAAATNFMPRLGVCLRQAGEEARLDGSDEVGTHHQLRGLMLEGVGAAVLETLGVTRASLGEASVRLFGESGPAGTVVPPDSGEARRAVAAASYFSREGGHDHVGTEHLLFVLASDPGSRSRRILNDLGVDFADVKRELEDFLRTCGNRRRRRGRGEAVKCSFCGKAESGDLRLVAGPGVRICNECVRRSSETLEERGSAR